MSSIASELRAQIEKIEEEIINATRKMREAKHLLPKLYQAAMLLSAEEDHEFYIPRYGAGASRTDKILAVLSEAEYGMRPVEIAKVLDDDANAVRTMLFYAKKRGLVQEHEGHYYLAGKRKITQKIQEQELEAA